MAAVDANAQPKPSATLIVTNAAVYTVDKQRPKAEAVAVIKDRIVAVGSSRHIVFPATGIFDDCRRVMGALACPSEPTQELYSALAM